MTTTASSSGPLAPVPVRVHRGFSLGLPLVVLLAAFLTMAGIGLLGTHLAQQQLGEARAAKAAAVAGAVQNDLERALGHGIPLSRIAGVDAYLEGIAGRNPDLGFLAVTGADGAVLQSVGLTGEGLAGLIAPLRGLAEPATRAAALVPVERDGFLIVRLSLRAGPGKEAAGHVLAGVQPRQVRSQIAGELVTVLLGVAAVLLLLTEVAAALAGAAFRAPLERLAQVMGQAARGDFGTLIGRRPRDQLGRALFAFNAAVFRMHDRRQRFAAHADEVRGAVFDPEVAREVERTRDRALASLGPGLSNPPRRITDARAVDVRAYAALVASAAGLAVLAGLTLLWSAPGGLPAPMLGAGVALAAGLLAARLAPKRLIRAGALLAALVAGLAAVPLLYGLGWAGLLPAAFAGALAGGASLRYAVAQAGDGGLQVLRALAIGLGAAVLWGMALGWHAGGLAASAPAPALLALLLARPLVVPRS